MEAFLAFDPHNYPFLVDYNSRFVDVIARIAFKQGIVPSSSKEAARRILLKSDSDELSTILVLVFAPYVASLRVLGQRNSSVNPLGDTLPNARIVFTEYMDHVILHVTDSSTSCKPLGHGTVTSERSLFYFVELIKLAFGSNPMVARLDEAQANLVRSLHRYWMSSHSSPVYLLEVNSFSVSPACQMERQLIILFSCLSGNGTTTRFRQSESNSHPDLAVRIVKV